MQRFVLETLRRAFHVIMLQHYCRVRGVKREAIEAWLPVVAAARLAERIPGEDARLLAMVKANAEMR
jgi:hypothetical protein